MTRHPSAGEAFGRYRLDRVLGRGGMGVVYAAHDTALEREVALKIVAPHFAEDVEFRARFQHEAEVLARVDSDRIVRIYDHGEHDGSLFIVTQLVDGGDLQRLVTEQGPLDPALAVDVACQVLAGLQDAHAVGVIHRDIKPANVLLRQRQGEVEAFLCDFGIATTTGQGFTMTGGVAGSLPYMAPERHEGHDATPVSDVYAVGCLLWHALTGSAPYAGTDAQVAMAHVTAPLPKLPGRDDFTRRVNDVLTRALAKEPRRRYASAREMAAALRPLASEAPGAIQLPGATAIRRPLVVRRRRWVPALVGAASVLAVVTVVVGVVALGNSDEPARRDVAPVPATPTETISAADGKLLGNEITLSPKPFASTRADGDVVIVEPPTLGVLPPAATEDAGVPGAGPTSRPTSGPKAGPPAGPGPGAAPAPTSGPTTTAAAPPPPPAARYRCWDSPQHKVARLDQCTMPAANLTGARWIFGRMNVSVSCRAYNRPDTPHDVAAWTCTVPNRPNVALSVVRWNSRANAVSFLRGFTGDGSPSAWTWASGTRIGASWSGTRDNRYRLARLYDIAPWSIQWSASSAAERNAVYPYVNDYQYPAYFRGEPL